MLSKSFYLYFGLIWHTIFIQMKFLYSRRLSLNNSSRLDCIKVATQLKNEIMRDCSLAFGTMFRFAAWNTLF